MNNRFTFAKLLSKFLEELSLLNESSLLLLFSIFSLYSLVEASLSMCLYLVSASGITKDPVIVCTSSSLVPLVDSNSSSTSGSR